MKIEPKGKYKYCKDSNGKQTTEHRKIMLEIDPRDNANELVIHHIDGDKSNNDPSNLMWMTNNEHLKLHHLGENHFPCDGKNNANYRHGMCVNGQSKEYKRIHNHKTYMAHREERLAKQNEYGEKHRDQKRLYDKIRYWERKLLESESEERKAFCENKLDELRGCTA